MVLRPLCLISTGIDWFFSDLQLSCSPGALKKSIERRYAMFKRTLSYTRYVLSALASIGFSLTSN